MAFYTGRTGAITIDGKKIVKVRDWSIESTVELLSTNTIDSGANTFVPGIKGATGSATLMYYRFEEGDGFNENEHEEFTALLKKVMQGGNIETSDRVSMILTVGAAGASFADSIAVDAYITSATVSVSSGELSVVPINFTVDGDFVNGISIGA